MIIIVSNLSTKELPKFFRKFEENEGVTDMFWYEHHYNVFIVENITYVHYSYRDEFVLQLNQFDYTYNAINMLIRC